LRIELVDSLTADVPRELVAGTDAVLTPVEMAGTDNVGV